MRRWPFLALVLIPLADVILLVWIAGQIGAVATVALVVLTALIGLLLVRAEGRHTLRRLQRQTAAGEVPTDTLLDGALLIAAGAFLLTPGLVTDLIGFLLVVPLTRIPLRAATKRWVVVPLLDRRSGGFVTGRVYTAGAPFESGDVPFGGSNEPHRGGRGGNDDDGPIDLDDGDFEIDIEDADNPDDEASNGNA